MTMGDPDDEKAFVARVALYGKFFKHQGCGFLPRNLRTILDAHEGRPREKKKAWTLFEKTVMADKSTWEAAFQAQKPMLTITGLNLRREGEHEGNKRARAPSIEDEDEDDGPAWLPRNDEIRLQCQITVAVHQSRPNRKPCYLDSRSATIVSRGRNSQDRNFEIRLHEPFEIGIEKLLVVPPSHTKEAASATTKPLKIGIEKVPGGATTQDRKQKSIERLIAIWGREPVEWYAWAHLGAHTLEGLVKVALQLPLWEDFRTHANAQLIRRHVKSEPGSSLGELHRDGSESKTRILHPRDIDAILESMKTAASDRALWHNQIDRWIKPCVCFKENLRFKKALRYDKFGMLEPYTCDVYRSTCRECELVTQQASTAEATEHEQAVDQQASTAEATEHKQAVYQQERWQRGLAEEYVLEVGIHCCNSEDTAELLRLIHGSDQKQYISAPTKGRFIRATWDKLPHLPQPNTLLPLLQAGGHHSITLPFGAEICMSWSEEQVSPLVHCNRLLGLERGERLQLPTPASDDLEGTRHSLSVKYLFRQAFQLRTLLTRDLKCILCEHKPEHSSFERLHLHYITHHDHLHFDVSNDTDIPDCKVFRIHIPEENPLAREQKLEPEESWEWQAPNQPFNISAHLDGDTMWTNDNVRPSRSTRATPRKDKTKRVSPPRSPLLIPTRPKREMLPPQDVADLPDKRVRRHKVPRVPNINFYRTTSKQQVEQGIEISDSDEEPDESWLEQTQRQHLVDMELDMFAIDFHEVFNKHLGEERPMSDRLTRDAVIRFARKFRVKLSDPDWSVRFRVKLDQLETGRVIGKDVVEYCLSMIALPRADARRQDAGRPSTPTRQTQSGESDLFPDSPGAFVVEDTPQPDEQKDKADTPQKDSSVPFGLRQIIFVRPGIRSSGLIPIKALARDKALPSEAIQPSDLSWDELGKTLDSHLGDVAEPGDLVWCSTNPRYHHVSPYTWEKVIEEAAKESKGPIRFELFNEFEEEERLAKEVAKREKEVAKRAKEKKNICVCDKRVAAARKTIACANPKCTRAFHMACVGLEGERRSLEWRCEDCSSER